MFSGGDGANVDFTHAAVEAVCGDDEWILSRPDENGVRSETCLEKFVELELQGGTCEAVQTFYDSYTPEEQAALSPEFKMFNAGCSILKFFTE